AESVQPPAPFLEERNHLRERIERFHAIARVIAAARMRPARVALLASGAERDDLGLALGPARAREPDVARKQDFVEGHSDSPLPTRDCAGDEAGEIGLAAAEALGIRRRDVDGDIAGRAR